MASFSETWTVADADSPNGTHTWVETTGDWDVESNEVVHKGPTSTFSPLRCSTDLASDDHSCEITIGTVLVAATTNVYPIVRFADASETGYALRYLQDGSAIVLRRYNNGSSTDLASTTGDALVSGDRIRLEADGDASSTTLTAYLNDVEILTTTTTTSVITGNTKIGFAAFANGTDRMSVTTVDAEDLGGATTVTPSTVAVPATLPAPTILAESVVTPAAITVPATLPTPAATIDADVTATTIPVPAALPIATVSVQSADAMPATINIPTTLPQATATGLAVVTPLTVEAVAALPAATANVGSIAEPATITVPATLPDSSFVAAAIVDPATTTVTTTLPSADAEVNTIATPAVIAVAATLPTATINTDTTVQPAVIMVNVAIPNASLFAGVLDIIARTFGQFQRRGSNRLHLARILRGGRRGYSIADENWERVSDIFVFDDDDAGLGNPDATMIAVAGAWAAHAESDAETLKNEIHTALDALGYRRPDGTRLV